MKKLLAEVKKVNSFIWLHKIFFSLIILYYVNILAISLLNGNYVCIKNICGIGISSLLFHDPIWHMALSSQAFNTIPFQMPIFSGSSLQGYHFLADFLYFLVSKIGFSQMVTYWKIMPQLFFVLFVYLAFYYALKLSKSVLFIFFYIFFLFFGGTLSFIPFFLHTGKLLGAGDSFLQINGAILSPNIAYSFLIFLIILIIVQNKNLRMKDYFLLSVCLFLQMGMKFYAGLTLFLFLNLYYLFFLLRRKTIKKYILNFFLNFIAFGLSILVFYDPFSVLKSSSVFIFSPFTLVHPFIESPTLYNLEPLVLARYTLIASHRFSPRLMIIELFTLAIFFFHYLGTFNIGFIYIINRLIKKTFTKLELILFLCVLFTIFTPVFFIQKGYYTDTIQFLHYGMFFMAYFASKTILMFSKLPKSFFCILTGIIILLAIPNNISDMRLPYATPRIFPSQELQALDFLKNQPAGAVATSQVDDSSYIPLFTKKQVYIADIQQLELTSFNYLERKKQIENFENTNVYSIPVKYFYILKNNIRFKKINEKFTSPKFKNIYENSMVEIYEKM